MSQEAEIMYEMIREEKERMYLNRVRNNTRLFYERYRNQFNEMKQKGFFDYIPDEMNHLAENLDMINSLLRTDPEAAREVSFEVGSYIRALWHIGNEAAHEFRKNEQIERELKKQEKIERERQSSEKRKLQKQETENRKGEILSMFYNGIGSLDPITAGFAANNIENIKNEIQSGEISSKQIAENRLKKIISKAEEEAAAWKNKKMEEAKKQAVISQIEEHKKALGEEYQGSDSRIHALENQLSDMKNRAMEEKISKDDVEEKLRQIEKEADNVFVEKNVRQRMVEAIIEWFSRHEFTVEHPQIVNGEIRIVARTPSSHRALFSLTPDCKCWYRLDGYEGQSCLKDIASAQADWEKVYGIKCSELQVTWNNNPDKINHKQVRTSNHKRV